MDIRDRLQHSLGAAYALERELGGGGMSRVFVAEETALRRKVVLKVLPPEMAGQVSMERFQREIALAAVLQHAHIVPLLTAGDAEGLPYFTMPYVEGESLRARLTRGGELPIGETMRIVREVATALAYAHDHGVVHRDIKPDNVLISGGSAMVTDFGVAKALSASSRADSRGLTSLGVALGTPAYMSPEQASADPLIDHRADLYALGATAYEMLTGQPPFAGRPPQAMLAAHVSEPPHAVTERRAGIPAPLGQLVMRCLAKRAADRPQTAAEIIQTLDAITTPSGGMTPTAPPGTGGRKNRAWMVMTVALVGVAGLASAAVVAFRRSTVTPARVTAETARTIAVLPLRNEAGSGDDDYFADGLTEELMSALAKVPGLRVAARSSAFTYKGKAYDVKQVGKALNVDAVLEGSVRRSGTQLRLTWQLSNASDGLSLGSDGYTREMKDVFAAQQEMAQAVVAALKLTLAGSAGREIAAVGTKNVVAHDAYLKGLFFFNKFSEPALRKALGHFQAAIALDPTYAAAWAGVADVWNFLADDWVAPREAYPKAREAALKAVSIDSTVAEGHAALAAELYWFEKDLVAAEREARRALALNPSYPQAYYYLSGILMIARRPDEANEAIRRAEQLDPLQPGHVAVEAEELVVQGRHEESKAAAQRALELDSTFALAHIIMGEALSNLRRYDEALRAFARGPGMGDRMQAGIALTYARMGRAADARRIALALEEQARRRYTRAESLAQIYGALGDRERAIRWIQRADVDRSAGVTYLNIWNVYDPIRGDPRVQEIIARLKLP